MDLLPLVCTKCGGPLSFSGSLVCECPACKTPHALVNFEGDLNMSVSYLPYVPATNGKMQKSFKIRFAEKVRSDTDKFVITDRYYAYDNFQKETLELVDGKVVCTRMVLDDGGSLAVGLTGKIEIKSFGKVVYSEPKVSEFCSVSIIPVKLDNNNVLAGHRVLIRVYYPEFEEEANLFSELIQKWFGVVPEVSLERS